MSNQPGSGWGGSTLGYGSVFTQSVAVLFDIHLNSGNPPVPYVALAVNGDTTDFLTNSGTARVFDNGNTWYCWVDFNGATQTLEVRLSSSSTRPTLFTLQAAVNLLNIIGASTMYLGFGAGSGGLYTLPVISAFSYAVSSIPDREKTAPPDGLDKNNKNYSLFSYKPDVPEWRSLSNQWNFYHGIDRKLLQCCQTAGSCPHSDSFRLQHPENRFHHLLFLGHSLPNSRDHAGQFCCGVEWGAPCRPDRPVQSLLHC